MSKPKYQIGDAFKITKKISQDGLHYEGTFTFYILAIQVESTDRGYDYKYGLGPVFPQAYLTANVKMWEYEKTLSQREQVEGYFGQA